MPWRHIRKTPYTPVGVPEAGGATALHSCNMPVHIHTRREWHAAALALVPMALALVGLCLDERAQFGYSNWLGACRAAGFDVGSLITFTVDLLPRASLGALLGVMLIPALGAALWRDGAPRAIFAAHAGCALGMAAMLLVCAWLPSLPLMLGVEALLAAGTTLLLCHDGMRTKAYSGRRKRGRHFSGSTTPQVPA